MKRQHFYLSIMHNAVQNKIHKRLLNCKKNISYILRTADLSLILSVRLFLDRDVKDFLK